MPPKSTLPIPKSILKALSLPLDDPTKLSFTSLGGSGFAKAGHLRVFLPSQTDDKENHEERHYFVKSASAVSSSATGEGSRVFGGRFGVGSDNENENRNGNDEDGLLDANAEMFRGEYASLNAIADAVPGFCPRALAWGSISDDDDEGEGDGTATAATGTGGLGGVIPENKSPPQGWFLATEFLNLNTSGSKAEGGTLAERLGRLHSTTAPPPPSDELVKEMAQNGMVLNGRECIEGEETNDKPQFGFPVPTFCGDVKQPNRFRRSWADFYANERLRTVLEESERRNGPDKALRGLVERTANEVVPRLLGDDHLGYNKDGEGDGITPVIVHGDLWCGNAGKGKIFNNEAGSRGGSGGVGDVVYDSSACYAHSEFELGIMKMFGGFSAEFYKEYHGRVPKTEPVGEYGDRVDLYEL